MNKANPKVSVVIVTMNNSILLKKCLNSLIIQDYDDLEILVVDNGSSEDIRGLLKTHFPSVSYIRLEKNLGFAGGNNRGIKEARGEYVALINNDAIAAPDWIGSMVKVAEKDRETGAVASLIIDGNQPTVLDSFGVGIALDGMSRQSMKGFEVNTIKSEREVLLFSGCACLLRMAALREVGFFDEDFFAYCEDTDLSLRLRLAGWKTIALPQAVVKHFYSKTGGVNPLNKVFWVERNHFWVVFKNFPLLFLVLLPVMTIYRYLIQLYFICRGIEVIEGFQDKNHLLAIIWTYLKSYCSMLYKLPSMIRKRFVSSRNRRVSSGEFFSLIWRFRVPFTEILAGRSHHNNARDH